MALVFHRRLAIPLWAFAVFTVARIQGLVPSLRPWPSVVQLLLTGKWRTCSEATAVAGASARTLDTPNRTTAEDALDLVRMDDDGGWQMPRPPA